MNQTALAEMLAFSDSAVSQILAGETRPLDETVRRIAEGLGEDFDYLIGYSDVGTVGTGKIIGRILSISKPEELAFLEELDDEAYHRMMGEFALKYAKEKRGGKKKALRTTILCVLGLPATLGAIGLLACPCGASGASQHCLSWTWRALRALTAS